ncbi:SRPBCC family protein [Alteromonas sp. CYL-A6]|uniref:SRPBCC family protein n=1 Tax=Alteromonas nitratireducens TaxID=3390813 RepID=UPI0034BE6A3D
MAILKKLILLVAGVLILFTLVGFFLPASYAIERSIVINAPASSVYPYVVDLKAWQQWGVWFKRDPQMEISYAGPDRAIGMRSEWRSDTEGNGEMEITQLEHNRKVVYRLYFPEFDMGSTGTMEMIPVDEGTRVVWIDAGSVGRNPVDRYFVLMMDSLIGPDFELGLENLKTVVENQG